MSFNHRYLWSTTFLRERLSTEQLSETATFSYFLVIMVFDWLQFTVIAITPTPSLSPWSVAGSWATFGITVFGLVFLYFQNGGGTGSQFLRRYFALSVTVGWKFVAAMFAVLWLIPIALAGQSQSTVGWTSTAALALINIAMFWRIGSHLESLSRVKQAPNPSFEATA